MSEFLPREFIVATGSAELKKDDDEKTVWSIQCRKREEIVRCRDCKWFTPEHRYEEEREYGVMEELVEPPDCGNPERCSHHYNSITGKVVPVHIVTDPDGFCAWAERRNDTENGMEVE